MSKLRNLVKKVPGLENLVRGIKDSQAAKREQQAFAHAKQSLTKFSPPYKINAGCGTIHFDGWINVDMDDTQAHLDLLWDVSKSLPVPDNSCDIIFSEHMVEHLSVDQGQQFLKECLRALQPGGTLRVAMPSLDDLLERCSNGNWRDQEWLQDPQWSFISTRAEMMNIMFRWWGHQWLYDREEFHRRLKQAGFNTVKDVDWGKSEVDDLNGRETRSNSLLICEAVKD